MIFLGYHYCFQYNYCYLTQGGNDSSGMNENIREGVENALYMKSLNMLCHCGLQTLFLHERPWSPLVSTPSQHWHKSGSHSMVLSHIPTVKHITLSESSSAVTEEAIIQSPMYAPQQSKRQYYIIIIIIPSFIQLDYIKCRIKILHWPWSKQNHPPWTATVDWRCFHLSLQLLQHIPPLVHLLLFQVVVTLSWPCGRSLSEPSAAMPYCAGNHSKMTTHNLHLCEFLDRYI